jgi:hypothetical protein
VNFKKIIKLLAVATLLPISANAEMKSEVFVGYNGLEFDRHDNDFIGTTEASDLESYNLGGYIIKDINDTTALSFLGKYVEYNTGGVLNPPEDDSPKDILTFEATVIRNIFNNSLGGFGLYYADMEIKQNGDNANKTMQGYNVSFVNDFNKLTYMITLGKQTSGSVESQDTVRNAEYAGIAFNYEFNDKIDFGFKYSTFVGKEYDEKTIKTEQTSDVSTIFADYKLPVGTIRAGYKLYDNNRKDVEGGGYGTSEDADGDAFILTYSIPIGNSASKKERMLITDKPDIVEFSTIGGSVGD